MTVGEQLKEWLNEFKEADFTDLATDLIKADIGSYAIFKSPNKTEIPFNDGSKQVTEYYQFFARQSTVDNDQRISNEQLLSDLENWVEEKELDEDYPDLSQCGNLTCLEIGIANSASITSQSEECAIYQVTINITYLKERN